MVVLLQPVSCRDPFEPTDPQRILDSGGMKIGDYIPPPGRSWNDATQKGSSTYKIALVTVDYEDQPFVITSPPGPTILGNPQLVTTGKNISRKGVPAFYRELFNVPSDLNHGRTLHEYWMEDSGGGAGVELIEYGPYRMPHMSYQYSISEDTNPGACSAGSICDKRLENDAKEAWRRDAGDSVVNDFKLIFILSAGQCEQQTRNAFGADKFASEQDVSDAFGPPRGALEQGSSLGNAAKSLGGWTSWASASRIWPEAIHQTTLSYEDSSLGTFVHEMSHVLSLKDNYPLPKDSVRRGSHAGSYSPMNRGVFNGPGNASWHIPSLHSVPSAHTVNEKAELFGLARSRLPFFDRSSMSSKGPVVVRIEARTASTDIIGLRITLDPDRSPKCDQKADILCDGGSI